MREIPYDLYLEFTSNLPCKDMFYFLNSLYVLKDNELFVVKSKTILKSKEDNEDFNSDLEKEYIGLKNNLVKMSLAEFLVGVHLRDKNLVVDDKYYKNKNIIIDL